MDPDEESRVLRWLLPERMPRLKWNSFWVVGTKRQA